MTTLDERAKAFREEHPPELLELSPFALDLKAELDWAEKNPPMGNDGLTLGQDLRRDGWELALTHVRSLLEEPKREK